MVGWSGDSYPSQKDCEIAKKDKPGHTWEEAVAWLRENGFDLLDAPGVQNRIFLKKNKCSAAIEKVGNDGVKIFAYPGCPQPVPA